MRSSLGYLVLAFWFFASRLFVTAQSTNSSSASATPSVSLNVTVVTTTSSYTTTSLSRSGAHTVSVTKVVPTIFNATITRTSTISPTATVNITSTPTPAPITLNTKLDPAFGVLGALLIVTGLPSAFWGHKNRWTSFFLIGFYTLAIVCLSLILKFGVLSAVNPPSKTLRGTFVLACAVAGIIGGGITIFFWKTTKYFIGAWGGFAFGLYVQCFRNGGLIAPVGLRWIMYIGCAVVGFVLCTIPKIHWHILLVSTAFVGASAFMLGVDCFTTAGLKEFYVWNLGFKALFPKFVDNEIKFPVTQTLQIELGLLAATALMGGAVQLRILKVLQRKLNEIEEENKKRDEEDQMQIAGRFADVDKEREQWERDHPTLSKHDRKESGYESSTPLIKDRDTGSSVDNRRSSTLTFGLDGRSRHLSGFSDLETGQSAGVLPTMDLGVAIKDDVPRSFMNDDEKQADLEGIAKKEALLREIQAVRRSIDALRSESPASDSKSLHLSSTSRRALSHDLGAAGIQSMELDRLSSDVGASIGRPNSAPLKDGSWDTYVSDRKLLQPPVGITPPIGDSSKVAVSPAVAEALEQRKQRESAYALSPPTQSSSSDDIPISRLRAQAKQDRPISNVPATILPPHKVGSPVVAPAPRRPSAPRTATFEEMADRHRQKMREMQAPLTEAEREQAELEAAKSRWERSKEYEKSATAKRQAEQAASYAKQDKSRKSQERRRSVTLDDVERGRHSRSLSVDRLGIPGGGPQSSKLASTMKVEDWQRYQQEDRSASSSSPRDSRAAISPVPFPGNPRRDPGYDRRKSARSSTIFQDLIK